MNTYIIVFVAILIIVFLIVNSKVKMSIKLLKNGENDEVVINISALYGLVRYKKEIPFVDLNANKEGVKFKVSKRTSLEGNLVNEQKDRIDIKTILSNYDKYKEIFSYLYKKIKIKEVISEIDIRDNNVFSTIIIFNIIHFIYSLIHIHIDAKYMSLRVHPGFEKKEFKIYFKGSFDIRIRNFLYLIKHYKLFINNGKVGA
ncbi:hypothetical protein [Alkalithermobacter paradoxus]|uniref:DUF2953 domain-containing protein n=1 Tax=Alkalithermobacter paradoxus TaxID=29349 RepID=A0A1V4IBF4_9FIRM|nr:hypothetical protein CLOTH_05390 [[Clostridium] thermoalcaliphilum]